MVCKLTGILELIVRIAFALPFIGSRPIRNYPDSEGLIHCGNFAETVSSTIDTNIDTIKVVTFNIKFAEKIDQAYYELSQNADLRDADVILLQEMDLQGTDSIAKRLKYNYVYGPASVHSKHNRDFGNAILSKWPISDSKRVKLPHQSPLNGQERIAVSAKIKISELEVLAYSVHTETVLLGQKERIRQAKSIAERVPKESKHVIVGGDFNTECNQIIRDTAKVFKESNFIHASEKVKRTAKVLGGLIGRRQMDHIFVKGMKTDDYGKLENTLASDHRPVWVKLKI